MIEWVTYEQFGAKGDGVTDDAAAIRAAHKYANEHKLPVRTRAGATYFLGRTAGAAIIMTDTDWGNSRFITDDRDLEDIRSPLFIVTDGEEPVSLPIETLTKGQKKLPFAPGRDYYVVVVENDIRRYIREGLNQNNGSLQTDNFTVSADGTIREEILWDFPRVTSVEARPIPKERLRVHGGYFTTIANQAESKYNYHARNIVISRSNTELSGLHHTVTGEGDHGAPYSGFVSVSRCADVVVRDCFLCPHKTYVTIGAAGKPVSMGTYDISIGSACNILFKDCSQPDILDRSKWGLVGSNFCKYVTFDGCVFSRTDAHQGMYNYTVRNCILGHMGINAIGSGTLTIENCELYGGNLFSLRGDYGSTWSGDAVIRNVLWHPACGDRVTAPVIIGGANAGMHDFGYECSQPSHILIENVHVDDALVPDDYAGPFLFGNYSPNVTAENRDTYAPPFPYKEAEAVTIRGLSTTSGKPLRLSPNPNLPIRTVVTQE